MTYTHEQLNDLRQRVLAGQDVPVEDYAALIQSLRQRRTGEVAASAARNPAAKKSAKPEVTLPDCLSDL